MSQSRLFGLIVVVGLALAAFVQLIPYGRDHKSPTIQQEPNWDSPRTRELVARACFDCHSNETTWPWYSNIAPLSWLVQRDVDEGRSRLNFSEWGSRRQQGHEVAEVVREGEMPPWLYGLMHSSSRLSAEEKDALISGLTVTLGR
jgi:hypothetical protein